MRKNHNSQPIIKTPQIPADRRGLHFSFQYLQMDHTRFPITECRVEFFIALFREIQRYQKFSVDQFKEPSPEEHRHPIIWSETHEPNGFPHIDPTQDETWTDDVWQFCLSPVGKWGDPSHLWRIHGFIADGAFYIVWLDPCHRLDC